MIYNPEDAQKEERVSPNIQNELQHQQNVQNFELSEKRNSTNTLVKKILLGIICTIIFFGGVFYVLKDTSEHTTTNEKIVRIGLSMDTLKQPRWSSERDIMEKKALELGATVTTFIAEGDDAKQISQIENFISQKMDVIIVVAHDATALSDVVAKAKASGIKVIDYDRLTQGTSPDLYLSFDSTKVGEVIARYIIETIPDNIAIPDVAYVAGSSNDNNAHLVSDGVMRVLDPLIESGKIHLVFSEYSAEWSPDVAYTNLKDFLNNGGHIDAVIAANDGLAYGSIRALSEYGLAGSVPVSGQDGDLQAIQRILQGTQTVSAYKPGRLLAEKAIEVAIDFAHGKPITTNANMNNGTVDVPSYLFDPTAVTKDNIDETVIKDGAYTREQVYTKK